MSKYIAILLIFMCTSAFAISPFTGVTSVSVVIETPAGTIDGVNTAFTLSNAPSSGSLAAYLNGMRQQAGGVDYTLSGAVVTFVTAPGSGSVLIADYRY